MLDWIFEGIVTWISSVVSDMMDAVSGLFLQALGTDMTAMEEYFPFVSKAFTVAISSFVFMVNCRDFFFDGCVFVCFLHLFQMVVECGTGQLSD